MKRPYLEKALFEELMSLGFPEPARIYRGELEKRELQKPEGLELFRFNFFNNMRVLTYSMSSLDDLRVVGQREVDEVVKSKNYFESLRLALEEGNGDMIYVDFDVANDQVLESYSNDSEHPIMEGILLRTRLNRTVENLAKEAGKFLI